MVPKRRWLPWCSDEVVLINVCNRVTPSSLALNELSSHVSKLGKAESVHMAASSVALMCVMSSNGRHCVDGAPQVVTWAK